MTTFVKAPASPSDPAAAGSHRPAFLGYVAAVAMVAAAALVAFVVDHIVQASNLSLVFVVPVILAALSFGWTPSLLAALLSVAVFNFFFVEPRMSFAVASPTDMWALGLLLVVAAIASTVAAESRRRALAAGQAARQAEALHDLAHAVIKAEPREAIVELAARSLGRMFDTPAVVLQARDSGLAVAASNGAATLSAADLDAAQWTLANGQPTRGETYPFDQASFDFWPVQTPASRRLVIGLKLADRLQGRPEAPERQIELVAAYLAAGQA